MHHKEANTFSHRNYPEALKKEALRRSRLYWRKSEYTREEKQKKKVLTCIMQGEDTYTPKSNY